MFERYTEQARRAIFFARYEASLQGASQITPGFILLGIMREGGPRSVAIRELKGQETKLRNTLGFNPGNGKPLNDPKKDMRLDSDSKKVLAYAAQEAGLDDSYWIDTDHLLRGLLRFPNEASPALNLISLDLATAQTLSRRNRAEFPQKQTLYARLFGAPFRTHRAALFRLLAVLLVVILGSLVVRWLDD